MQTGKIELRTNNKFYGLYALEKIRQGEVIFNLPITTQAHRDKYSIEIIPGIHIDCSQGAIRAINHSCNPNAAVRKMRIIAWSCIEPEEEITIDYRKTEEHLYAPFVCNCCNKWMQW